MSLSCLRLFLHFICFLFFFFLLLSSLFIITKVPLYLGVLLSCFQFLAKSYEKMMTGGLVAMENRRIKYFYSPSAWMEEGKRGRSQSVESIIIIIIIFLIIRFVQVDAAWQSPSGSLSWTREENVRYSPLFSPALRSNRWLTAGPGRRGSHFSA